MGTVTDRGPIRALVVDGRADARDSLCLLLAAWGFDARPAADGAAALVEAEAFRPEVVFLGVGLPGMEGPEVSRRLGQLSASAPPLVVGVIGWGGAEARARALAAGCHLHRDMVAAPDALHRLLDRWAAPADDAQPQPPEEPVG